MKFLKSAAMAALICIAFAANAQSGKSGVSDTVLAKIRAATGVDVSRDFIAVGALDGDNIADAAVLHAPNKNKAYNLIILKGAADGSFTKVFDKPAARCLDCLGVKGRPPIVKIKKKEIQVSEMGGSRWAWSNDFHYRSAGNTFALVRLRTQTFDSLTGDVVDRRIYLNSGLERRRISYGPRSEYSRMRKRAYRFDAFHLVSGSAKAAVKIDGLAGEAAWARAKTVRAVSGSLIYYGRQYRRGRKDLSFHVKSLYDDRYVYFFVDVRDDRRVFGNRAGVGTDHVELWLAGATAGDDTVFMNPKFDAKRTIQIGLVPVRGSSRVLVRRWYPKNRPVAGVEARYRKTRRGWSMEIRMEKNLVFAGNSSTVLFTAAVSDADTRRAGRRKSLMGTSRITRRAPGFLGVLVRDSIMNQGWLTGLNGD